MCMYVQGVHDLKGGYSLSKTVLDLLLHFWLQLLLKRDVSACTTATTVERDVDSGGERLTFGMSLDSILRALSSVNCSLGADIVV